MSLKRRRYNQEEIDPMASAVNMTDLMLVLAVGFLIFAVMATGAQSIMSNTSPQNSMQSAQQTTELEDQTQQLDETPENVTDSGSGYTEMGKVYKDPSTGKMVMVSK